MTFSATIGTATTIQAIDSIRVRMDVGKWELPRWQNGARRFFYDINNHQARWAAILINGTFSEEVGQEGSKHVLSWNSNDYFCGELPPPPEIGLQTGVYDATPIHHLDVTLRANGCHYQATVISNYSSNQAYVESSFQVNGRGFGFKLDFASNSVVYTFQIHKWQ
jgi:hypothetical protein